MDYWATDRRFAADETEPLALDHQSFAWRASHSLLGTLLASTPIFLLPQYPSLGGTLDLGVRVTRRHNDWPVIHNSTSNVCHSRIGLNSLPFGCYHRECVSRGESKSVRRVV
jgi:hypothetical protein